MKTIFRRKKEGKTDYKLRLKLLKSGLPRIVIRKTNKYFIAQAIESNEARDVVLGGVCSKDLIKNGWDNKFAGSLKRVPEGYLTGLLLAKKWGKGKFIVDLGMARTLHGNRVYAVVNGLVDGGLDIAVNKKVFPSAERISGEHLKPEIKAVIVKVKEKLKWVKRKLRKLKK